MKITQEMVYEFNKVLENCGSIVRIEFLQDYFSPNRHACKTTFVNLKFIDSFTLNVNNDFFDIINSFFYQRGVELSFNNNGSIFWADIEN